MKTYYHGTTPENPDNMILGYVDEHGDFVSPSQYRNGRNATIKIIVESGLLTCGESYENFCQRVAREATKHFKTEA